MNSKWICTLAAWGSFAVVSISPNFSAVAQQPVLNQSAPGKILKRPAPAASAEQQKDSPRASSPGTSDPETVLKEIEASAEKIVADFNAGNAAEIANSFLPEGEWVDEEGNVYRGRQSIQEILTKYFNKYPGARIAVEIDDVRLVGPVAIEEGTRTMSVGENSQVLIDYVAILAKTEQGWQYASVTDTAREVPMTAHAALEPLGWLVGDWINEGQGAVVKINYRWSEDANFLLGEYVVEANDSAVMTTTHRIGWDPLHKKVHSWLFDSDGGIGEGVWTPLDDSWHIHSSAILPDGRAGSAIVDLTPHEDGNRFTMRGTDRLVDGIPEEDFELNVVRQAPGAASETPTQNAPGAGSSPRSPAGQPGTSESN